MEPHWANSLGVQRVNDKLTWLLVVFSMRTLFLGPASAVFSSRLQLFGSDGADVAVGRINDEHDLQFGVRDVNPSPGISRNAVGLAQFHFFVARFFCAGNFVEPSFETFEDAAETGDFNPKKSFYLWLTNAPGKNSWPIAGATFILLAKEKTGGNRNVVKFFDWAFKNGDNKAKELVYVPLPNSLKDKVRAYWKANGLQ